MRKLGLMMLAGAMVSGGAANGAMFVIGTGDARACYLAAELKSDPRTGLLDCNRALDDGTLTMRDRVATLVNKGIVRIWAGDEEGALAEFDAALALRPALAEAKVNKAVALVRLNRDRVGAIALLNEALAANVSRPEVAHYTRALAHELSGDLAAAYRDYRRAAELKPEWSDPARQLTRFTVVRGEA